MAVGSELKLAAVVVGIGRMFDPEDRFANRLTAPGVGAEGIDVDITFGAPGSHLSRVGNVEATRAVKVRSRCDREQTALDFAAADQRTDIGELRNRACRDFVHHAFAFGDQQPFWIARVGADGNRLFEFADRLQRQRCCRGTP